MTYSNIHMRCPFVVCVRLVVYTFSNSNRICTIPKSITIAVVYNRESLIAAAVDLFLTNYM